MVRLRRTTEVDLPLVLETEASQDSARWLGTTGEAWHQAALLDPDQEHLVICDYGAVVGFVVLAGVSTPRVELRRLVLCEQVRGRGLGRLALRAVLARPVHADRVWLDVKTTNERAQSLYRAEGFAVDRVLEDAGQEPDGTAYSLVLMSRTVLRVDEG